MKTNQLKEERGMALVIAMMLLLVTTLIGVSAVTTTTFDNLIAGNKRASEQAFYVTEAGINEFLGRFRSGATNKITDSAESNTTETTPPWRILLAKSSGMGATKLGASDANTTSVTSLQTQLDYGVKIKHKIDGASPPNIIKYYGKPVYILNSYGFTGDGGSKEIEMEIRRTPQYYFDAPAPLYAENPVNIKGSSTLLQGNDQCGTKNKPGIITTLPSSSVPNPVDISGGPTVEGDSAYGTPSIQYGGQNLELKTAVDFLKKTATHEYSYPDAELTTLSGQSWGQPTCQTTGGKCNTTKPLSPELNTDGTAKTPNIVYFDMQKPLPTSPPFTPEFNTLKLAGGTTGQGILIVNGNLDLSGGFQWYGIIIVTGALDYTGGGEKNVTGGIMAGETATIEIDVAGNAGILYCSGVSDWLKNSKKIPENQFVRWKN